ncbi:MAG: hypothetical protein WBO67_17930, partial [Nitrospira sp.]
FSLNIGDESGRPVEAECFPAPKGDAEQRIEADKVVHMCVRDEDVAGAQEAGRAQGIVVAQIEEESAFGPANLHEQAWIAEDIIAEVA